MKLFFTISAILLIGFNSYAQKVFSVPYANQADVKVFVVDYENQAGWRNKSKQQLMY